MLKAIFKTMLILSAATAYAQESAPKIGQVLYTSGQVKTGAVALKTGQALPAAAHLVSERDSQARLRMQDDTLIALGESSNFQVEQYLFKPKDATETNRARYVLRSGSVRLVSGVMSRLNPGSVTLVTPYGDVTTLGTDYSAGVCGAGCASAPGVYLSVKSGKVSVAGSQGVTVVGTGQTVKLSATGAEAVASTPGFMLALNSDSFPSLDTNGSTSVRLGADTQDFLNGVTDPAASPSQPVANNSR